MDEVGRNDHILGVGQNPLKLAFGGLLHCGADLVVLGGLCQIDGQVNDGDVQRRNAHGHAGQLAIQRGDDLAHSLGRAGGGGDDVVRSAAAAAPVLHGNAVHGLLRGGDGVYGGHEALGDAEGIVQHLGHRREAVGRAGCVGHELHVRGVGLVVDAHNEHGGIVLGGGGHNNVLCAGGDMALRLFLGQEQAGGLDHVLCANLVPLQVRGILFRGDADGPAVDDEGIVGIVHGAVETAVNGVILEHVRHVVRRDQVVDANDFDVGIANRSAEDETANAAKAIDTNLDCHKNL